MQPSEEDIRLMEQDTKAAQKVAGTVCETREEWRADTIANALFDARMRERDQARELGLSRTKQGRLLAQLNNDVSPLLAHLQMYPPTAESSEAERESWRDAMDSVRRLVLHVAEAQTRLTGTGDLRPALARSLAFEDAKKGVANG